MNDPEMYQNSQNNSLCQENKLNLEEFLYISSSKSPPEHVDSLDHAQGTCHAMDMQKTARFWCLGIPAPWGSTLELRCCRKLPSSNKRLKIVGKNCQVKPS